METKKVTTKIYIYFLFALAALAAAYIPSLINLCEAPLFSKFAGGNYEKVFSLLFKAVFYIIFAVLLIKLSAKYSDLAVFKRKDNNLSLKKQLIIYVTVILCVFIAAWIIGFNINALYMLSKGSTVNHAFNTIAYFVDYFCRGFFVMFALCFFQEGFEKLLADKIKFPIPYGGLAVMLTAGLIEILFNNTTLGWVFFAFNLIYGIIYLVSDKRFFAVYGAMVLIVLF